LKTRNRYIRSTEKQSTPRAEEGYCNEATQSGPLTHNQSHQAQNTAEHTEVKQRKAWTKEEIREVIWCYMYCRQHFTENYKKLYEIWRQRKRVIPVIIGATGTISKSFRKYVSNISGNHEVRELRKTAISGTAHILRKVLM